MDSRKAPQTSLPIGQAFFDHVIERGYYYVDKTLLIKDILDKGATVTLCTRPRRFGKTLNQTMLKCFFEDTAELGGKDTRALFNGLKIETAGAKYLDHQGKYPVIFLSFKDWKLKNFETTYEQLTKDIAGEFKRHAYLEDKIADHTNLETFKKLSDRKGSENDYHLSLKFLSKCLEDYHGKKVIILIDEYDVPLENSWVRGFYQEMVDFIRPLLGSALKDNPHLDFSVITGCLRISKESIFTGMNNLDVVSILSDRYDEHFGFTQNEMDVMLRYYNQECKAEIVREWYDGYIFGSTEVYNPWSSINVVNNWNDNINRHPEPHWVNTSGNDIVRSLIDEVGGEAKMELETLITGGTISKTIHEDITYDEIYKNANNLWNFMFFTGYLKKTGEGRLSEDGEWILDLSIPNMELRYIYTTKIREWVNEKIKLKDFGRLYEAVLNGNAQVLQEELSDFLLDTISYMDGREGFYHGIMLGVLAGVRHYYLKSNRETGTGRCDIVMRHASGHGKAVIFELKWTANMREIEKKSEEALKQIEDGMYTKELEEECYTDIVKYGIAFCKKSCEVRSGK